MDSSRRSDSEENNSVGQKRPRQFDAVRSTSKWLECIASAKVWQELEDRGFGIGRLTDKTNIEIKGIEEKQLLVYHNTKDKFFYITTCNKANEYNANRDFTLKNRDGD